MSERLMRRTIVYALPTGVSAHGDPIYGDQVQAKARFEEDQQVLQQADGQEVVVVGRLATFAPLVKDARVWLPGANPVLEADARLVQRVRTATSVRDGRTLVEVLL